MLRNQRHQSRIKRLKLRGLACLRQRLHLKLRLAGWLQLRLRHWLLGRLRLGSQAHWLRHWLQLLRCPWMLRRLAHLLRRKCIPKILQRRRHWLQGNLRLGRLGQRLRLNWLRRWLLGNLARLRRCQWLQLL
jgi:hypothetical protein